MLDHAGPGVKSPQRGVRPARPSEPRRGAALGGAGDAQRIVGRAFAQARAQAAAGEIQVRAGIDEHRLAVNGEPDRQRVRVAVRGERRMAERAVVEHEMDGAAPHGVVRDRVAAARKCADARASAAGPVRAAEQGVAQMQMRIARGRREVFAPSEARHGGRHGGDVARLAVRRLTR